MSKKKDKDLSSEETTDLDTDQPRQKGDPRAIAAMSGPRSIAKMLGMPLLLVGLLAIIVGFGWGRLSGEWWKIGPMGCLVGGLIATAYGVWFGLKPLAAQLHGRGWLVVLVSCGLTCTVLVLLVGLNVLALASPRNIDMTSDRFLSLSEQSREVLGKVAEEVQITLAISTSPFEPRNYDPTNLRRQMREYEAACKYIEWEEVDVNRKPGKADELGIAYGGKAIIESGDRREEVTLGPDNEEGLTAAIYRVTKVDKTVVYALTGHAELSLDEFRGENTASAFRKALENVQYEIKDLALAKKEAGSGISLEISDASPDSEKALDDVPEDASAVIILGARTPLLASEISALQRYLARHEGGLMIALAYQEGAPDFSELLNEYDVYVEPGVVIDPYQYMLNEATPAVDSPSGHETLENIVALAFPLSRAMRIESAEQPNPYGGPPPNTKATGLFASGPQAWLETKRFWAGESDVTMQTGGGPHQLAVVIDTAAQPSQMPPGMAPPEESADGVRIVCLGSYMALSDEYSAQLMRPGWNWDFGTRVVGWLSGVGSISIPAKKPSTFQVSYSRSAKIIIAVVILAVMPFGTLLIGLVIWRIRR